MESAGIRYTSFWPMVRASEENLRSFQDLAIVAEENSQILARVAQDN